MSDERGLDEFMPPWSILIRLLCCCRRRFGSHLVKLCPKLGTFLLVYRQVYRPWKKYIHDPPPDELIGQVRYAIAQKYFDRGATGIDGKETAHEAKYHTNEGRPSVIVTDFVNYAELVKTIVETSLDGVHKRNKEEVILCFTSLRLSLHDWFNFDRGLYSDSKWSDDYLKKIEGWSKGQDIIVARHLLCASDEGLAQACGIKGRTKEVLKQELNSWIWRPLRDGTPHLKPICKSSRKDLAQEIKNKAPEKPEKEEKELLEISKFIEERYNEPNMAFVIVDNIDTKLNELELTSGEFQRLGDAFSSIYQTELKNSKGRLLTYGVAKSDQTQYPGIYYIPHDQNQRPIATDFFLVCAVKKANFEEVENPYQIFKILDPEPLFCLEGQDRAKAVHLTLLDAGKNEKCLEGILDYCQKLLSQNEKNKDLFSNA